MRTQHAYREQDYKREDESAVIPRPTKCYVLSELVIETAAAHGLRCERVSFPAWDFVIVKVWATKAQYKAAQYEWLQKMIATQPRQNVPTSASELDLFA